MRAEFLPQSICAPNLVLVAQAVFPSEHGHIQTDTQTHKVRDATDHLILTHWAVAGLGN